MDWEEVDDGDDTWDVLCTDQDVPAENSRPGAIEFTIDIPGMQSPKLQLNTKIRLVASRGAKRMVCMQALASARCVWSQRRRGRRQHRCTGHTCYALQPVLFSLTLLQTTQQRRCVWAGMQPKPTSVAEHAIMAGAELPCGGMSAWTASLRHRLSMILHQLHGGTLLVPAVCAESCSLRDMDAHTHSLVATDACSG